MSNDNGCISGVLALLIVILAVMIAGSSIALPMTDWLAWDTTASAERQQTERMRIEQEAITARMRIEQEATTIRYWILAIVLLGGIAIAGAVIVSVAKVTNRPSVPSHVDVALRLLPPSDGYRAEWIDGDWRLVSDVRHDWIHPADIKSISTSFPNS
jgi:hypothetical protein